MIHIAIISHGHEDLLITSSLCGLQDAGTSLKIWLKDNRPSARLKVYCTEHDIHYTDTRPGLGFGANNNFLFQLIQSECGFAEGDSFIVLNPDIKTSPEVLEELVRKMHQDDFPLATLNLFRDEAYAMPDANIRRFPDIWSLPRMLLERSLSQPYRKTDMLNPCHVDWASGALLAFTAAHYERLHGFDDRYFMYFEDVDLCYRSQKLLGKGVRYYPQLSAVHSAAHKNRNLVSRHVIWFFHSFLKFLSRRYSIYDRQCVLPVNK